MTKIQVLLLFLKITRNITIYVHQLDFRAELHWGGGQIYKLIASGRPI